MTEDECECELQCKQPFPFSGVITWVDFDFFTEVGGAAPTKSKIFGGREKLTLTLCSEFCSLAWAARFPWAAGRPRAPVDAGHNRAPLEAATRTQPCELRGLLSTEI